MNLRQIVNTDVEHFRIHQGVAYTATGIIEAVAAGATANWLIRNPDTIGSPHIVARVIVGGDAAVAYFENPVVTDDGTAMIVSNRNRRPPVRPADTLCFQEAAISAPGSPLLARTFIAGGTGFVSGGGTGNFREFIMAPDSEILIQVENLATSAQPQGMIWDFYEPVGGTYLGLPNRQ